MTTLLFSLLIAIFAAISVFGLVLYFYKTRQLENQVIFFFKSSRRGSNRATCFE